MNFLPTEIVSIILHYVDRTDFYACALINKQFYAVVSLLLWHTIHLPKDPFLGISFLHCLITARSPVGDYIRSVHLQGFPWTDHTLLALLRRAPFLKHLVLDNGTRIGDASIACLGRLCPHLQSLYLAGSPITHRSYHILGRQSCLKLTSLTLLDGPGLLPTTFQTHFVDSRLQKLELAVSLPDLDDDDDEDEELLVNIMDPFLVNEATLDLSNLHHLTHLKIHGPPFGMVQNIIDHRGGVAVCWPYLSILELEGCFDLMDDDAQALIQGLSFGGGGGGAGTNLTCLALKDGAFTDATLDTIAFCLPQLKELDVSSNILLTPMGIRRVIRDCHRISYINLSYCAFTMDDFPEANLSCAGPVVMFDGTHIELDHLCEESIEKIRRAQIQ